MYDDARVTAEWFKERNLAPDAPEVWASGFAYVALRNQSLLFGQLVKLLRLDLQTPLFDSGCCVHFADGMNTVLVAVC
jgi:hypothetical protein